MKKVASVAVEQNPEKPVEPKVLAQAILDISAAMRRLSASGLNRKAIVTLVADSTNQYKGTVNLVLDALERLEANYCK